MCYYNRVLIVVKHLLLSSGELITESYITPEEAVKNQDEENVIQVTELGGNIAYSYIVFHQYVLIVLVVVKHLLILL